MRKFVFITFVIALSTPLIGKFVNSGAIKMSETPKYLYKIISLRNWQATQTRKVVALSSEDHDFIHFSKEDQVDQVVKKHWSDAEQFVVLKIDAGQLEGKLNYEVNMGGTTKYYHLYDGFIPFNSIAESKVVYNHPKASCASHTLDIVQVGDAVLRHQARQLSVEEILSPRIQNLIESMKGTMRDAPGVGLAAPQIGESIQLAVIEDLDQSQLTDQEKEERKRYPVPFHVIINPRLYIEKEANIVEFFEGCLSVPEFVGVVPRAETVRVECLNEKAEPIVIHASGWYARILQHEIDHLNGTLYIDRAHLSTLITSENYVKLWKGKSVQETQAHLALLSR